MEYAGILIGRIEVVFAGEDGDGAVRGESLQTAVEAGGDSAPPCPGGNYDPVDIQEIWIAVTKPEKIRTRVLGIWIKSDTESSDGSIGKSHLKGRGLIQEAAKNFSGDRTYMRKVRFIQGENLIQIRRHGWTIRDIFFVHRISGNALSFLG